ncbi:MULTISPECIES: hypothetical protein [Dyella]|nr:MULTISPECIES: hypothetical protein [Dyella]
MKLESTLLAALFAFGVLVSVLTVASMALSSHEPGYIASQHSGVAS